MFDTRDLFEINLVAYCLRAVVVDDVKRNNLVFTRCTFHTERTYLKRFNFPSECMRKTFNGKPNDDSATVRNSSGIQKPRRRFRNSPV